MNTISLNQESFDSTIASTALPVLIDFGAEWCGPCQQLNPIIDELATEQLGRFLIAKVDVDAAPDLAKRFNIRAIPTLIVFKDGQSVNVLRGFQTKKAITAALAAA